MAPRQGAGQINQNYGISVGNQFDYLGAFGETLWTSGWTVLSEYGFMPEAGEGTSIDRIAERPSAAALGQNYPNPFNPTTTIDFYIERAQQVRLAVYDLAGREVAVLVDGVQGAGTYRMVFDAAGLASGVYLYRLVTGDRLTARRMTLLR